MLKARIAVFVSGGGTNLQALLDAEKEGKLPSGEIALVVSNKPDVYALERASAAGVEGVVLHKKVLGQEAFEKQLIALLEEKKIDLIVLAGFLAILSEDFVKRYPRRIINIHP
ncbi:MAG: phosphoribosylglycinamide formyltransferase, partial [Clostridia bacterium]|nr:phosphoribosylglycinamide formyltransferase [Clostridia bacterium]